jgi:ribonuclease-3
MIVNMKNKKFISLEKQLNYNFKDKNLLIEALTHKTYAFEADKPLNYNERLEFLGDSILGFLVAEQLYKSNKYFSEGELTHRRSLFVNNRFLANKAKDLKLGKFLLLGKGEIIQRGSINPTNLANALEALIGAIYLDSNIDKTRDIVLNHIFDKDSQF